VRVALHVGQLLQPVPGGIGRYVRALVRALPPCGVGVEAFAAGARPDGVGADVPYTDLGWPRGALRYEAWHRLRWPGVERVPGDLVHATSLAVPPPGGRPLVVTVHDLVFLRQPGTLTRRGVAFHRRGLELSRGATVVVPTAFGRDDLAAEGFDPERIFVAHHGVDPPPPPAPAPAPGRPYLLFVGTLEPRKGVPDLLDAHAALRSRHPDLDLELVLAGPPGWGEPPDVDRPGVRVLGDLGDDALDELYRGAVALAHPARYEGFGLTLVEAMARGCPVVCTDAACLPEIAGGAATLVPVGDVDALAGALEDVLTDAGRRAAMADAGRARAAEFTWERSAAAHRLAYEAAAA
jgi:glycosyltransferase involved in cell wall biosynthesis